MPTNEDYVVTGDGFRIRKEDIKSAKEGVERFEAKDGRLYAVLQSGKKRWATKAEREEAIQMGLFEDPDGKGTLVPHASKGAPKARPLPDFRPAALGAIWQGLIEALRARAQPNPKAGPKPLSAHDVLPWAAPSPAQFSSEEEAWRHRYREEMELGRELLAVLPVVAETLGLSAAELAEALLPESELEPAQSAGHHHEGAGALLSKGKVPTQSWIPPVKGRISQAFDPKHHKGVDIAVAEGTPIRAPRRMVIDKVGFDDIAGHHVIATIDEGQGFLDDSEWRLTFAHLSNVTAQEGQTVPAGHVFAFSGKTGRVFGEHGGAHLHWRVEFYRDNTFPRFDERFAVDPFAVVPREAIESGRALPPSGQPKKVAPRKAAQMPASTSGAQTIIISPHGQVSIGGHGVVNPRQDIDTHIDDLGIVLSSAAPSRPPSVLEELGFADDAPDGLQSPAHRVELVTHKQKPGQPKKVAQTTAVSSGPKTSDIAHDVLTGVFDPNAIAGVGTAVAAAAPVLTAIPKAGLVLGPLASAAGPAIATLGASVAEEAGHHVATAAHDLIEDVENFLFEA